MNYNNICKVKQPDNVKTPLFAHQLASIYNMERLEHDKTIITDNCIKEVSLGVNADLAGYGKTNSMVGLIARNKMEWDLSIPFIHETITTQSNGLIKTRKIERYNKLPTTLILVSPTILEQWTKEISFTNLNQIAITSKKEIESTVVENYDIVITIPSMYNNLVQIYSKYAWKRFIFDEPANIRVPGMRDVKAGFVWFVTAQPNAIISYHQSCRGSMIHKIIDNNNTNTFTEQFNGIIIKNNDDFIKTSFIMPKTNYINYYCFQPIFTVIKDMVNPNICQLIDSGNIEGAITALGGSKTKNIVELVKRKKLEEIESIKAKINMYNIRENTLKINQYINLQKEIEKQLANIDERFNNMLTNQNCYICLNTMNNIVMEPNCQNLFCGDCLLKWLKNHNNCPICRTNIVLSELIYIENENSSSNHNNNQDQKKILLKTEQIIDIIKANSNGKFLIFSEYEGSFLPICKVLETSNINFVVLKGNIMNRTTIINNYKNGNINVIFLNSTQDSAGINLQETTDIILYHQMSSSTKNQIIARAERIGRTKELNVHQLLVHI
jgi:hypothetical protein